MPDVGSLLTSSASSMTSDVSSATGAVSSATESSDCSSSTASTESLVDRATDNFGAAGSAGLVLVGIAFEVEALLTGVELTIGMGPVLPTTGRGPVSSRPVRRAVSISASSSSIVVSETVWPAVSAAARASDIEIVSSSPISSSVRRTVSCDANSRSRPARNCSI